MNKFTSLYIIIAAILMVSCAQVTLSGSGNIVTRMKPLLDSIRLTSKIPSMPTSHKGKTSAS